MWLLHIVFSISAYLVVPIICSLVKNNTASNIVCYYVPGKIGPEDLDPTLCTHVNYAFVRLNETGDLVIRNPYLDITKGFYKRTVAMKERNPQLKVLLSVGDTGASVFSTVAASSEATKRLVDSTVHFLKTYSFDGLDVDWEKPGPKDTINFVNLLGGLRKALDEHGWILSAAVYPFPSSGYNVAEITKSLHLINLMCYNFYGPWSTCTGQNSPLFASPLDSPYQRDNLNVAAALAEWLQAGAPKDKVIVGVPFYGRTFILADREDHGLHAPILGAGSPATLKYSEICTNFNNWTTVWDDDQKNHYKYTSTQWLGYDDEKSMKYKARYVVSQGVAGIMVWQISMDDVQGDCGRKQNILKVINEELRSSNTVNWNFLPSIPSIHII